MKTIIATIALCVLAVITGFSQAKQTKKLNTIVLVHGAWVDATAWNKVVPLLKAAGHEVINVNLPGHGKDNTNVSSIQLQTYVDAVKAAIGNRKDVTLVGHSMAGLIISQTAEQIPGQIRNLVYVGAFLPRNGESPLQLSNLPENKESLLGKYLQPDEKTGTGSVAAEGLIDVFAADAPQADKDRLLANRKPDALAPLATPLSATDANLGRIPKTYVFTFNDMAIAYALQQLMVSNTHVDKTYTIPSSHTPFISMPGVVAAILLEESKQH